MTSPSLAASRLLNKLISCSGDGQARGVRIRIINMGMKRRLLRTQKHGQGRGSILERRLASNVTVFVECLLQGEAVRQIFSDQDLFARESF